MKETGVFLGSLVQNLAQLREAAVSGLKSLQAEQDKLEEEIRKAQERQQTVIDSQLGVTFLVFGCLVCKGTSQ